MTLVWYDELEFVVPEGVYQPRKDSRLLADVVEQELDGSSLLDVGTGCGYLAVIAASEGADAVAVDINEKGLRAARENADRNDVAVRTVRSDMFDAVDAMFDYIVFNPPYLPGSRDDVSMEQLAWNGGTSGRKVLERFIEECSSYLAEDGVVLIVQSSLTGEEETLRSFREEGFEASVVARQKVSWEELQVVVARKA